MALKLYSHPLASFCWKSLIALYENGTPFEMVMVNLGDPEAKAKFEAMWPTAKIPLLEDDGRIVPETTIMIEYLDRRHPGKVILLPRDPEEELDARLWDRVFDLYVMDPMQRFIGQQLRPEAERDARTVAEALAALASAYDMIEKKFECAHLGSRGKLQYCRLRSRTCTVLLGNRRAISSEPHKSRPLLRTADGTTVGSARYQRGTALLQIFPTQPRNPAPFSFGQRRCGLRHSQRSGSIGCLSP